ncbi:chromate efflux transporter [Leucobacter albus]|uniref:Chromate efflux transporter n=1 Tax=Leucobacter albus TaxID=272210 RepID=A0ABW3TTU4_9MICO
MVELPTPTERGEGTPRRGTTGEVFLAFLRLGLTSFGGPTAHLGFFRSEFVERRGWVTDREYANLVALCQVLPGPASSQVGFALGLRRAGALGGLAAFIAFTLPSAVALLAFAYGATTLEGPLWRGALAGLGVAAVAIVAHAVLGMARSLTPDLRRAGIACTAAAAALLFPGVVGQLLAIALGATGGALTCRAIARQEAAGRVGERAWASRSPRIPRRSFVCLATLGTLLVAAPLLARTTGAGWLALVDANLRAGSLVFGGGHVVLPLLHAELVTPGWVTETDFAAGYAAAQAVPGPLFTFAGYLGALSGVGPGGAAGAALALVAIFTPGLLLVAAIAPVWSRLSAAPGAAAVLLGINAAVVGILAAALYRPIITSAITGLWPLLLALACFALLQWPRVPAWAVVAVGAGAGVVGAAAGAFG